MPSFKHVSGGVCFDCGAIPVSGGAKARADRRAEVAANAAADVARAAESAAFDAAFAKYGSDDVLAFLLAGAPGLHS